MWLPVALFFCLLFAICNATVFAQDDLRRGTPGPVTGVCMCAATYQTYQMGKKLNGVFESIANILFGTRSAYVGPIEIWPYPNKMMCHFGDFKAKDRIKSIWEECFSYCPNYFVQYGLSVGLAAQTSLGKPIERLQAIEFKKLYENRDITIHPTTACVPFLKLPIPVQNQEPFTWEVFLELNKDVLPIRMPLEFVDQKPVQIIGGDRVPLHWPILETITIELMVLGRHGGFVAMPILVPTSSPYYDLAYRYHQLSLKLQEVDSSWLKLRIGAILVGGGAAAVTAAMWNKQPQLAFSILSACWVVILDVLKSDGISLEGLDPSPWDFTQPTERETSSSINRDPDSADWRTLKVSYQVAENGNAMEHTITLQRQFDPSGREESLSVQSSTNEPFVAERSVVENVDSALPGE